MGLPWQGFYADDPELRFGRVTQQEMTLRLQKAIQDVDFAIEKSGMVCFIGCCCLFHVPAPTQLNVPWSLTPQVKALPWQWTLQHWHPS